MHISIAFDLKKRFHAACAIRGLKMSQVVVELNVGAFRESVGGIAIAVLNNVCVPSLLNGIPCCKHGKLRNLLIKVPKSMSRIGEKNRSCVLSWNL